MSCARMHQQSLSCAAPAWHDASGRVVRRSSVVSYVAIAALAALCAVAPGSAQLMPGQYKALLLARSKRQLAGRATYTRCGEILHIWLADTLSPDLSLEFGTSARTLGPRRFPIAQMDPLGPAPSGSSGYVRVLVPPDTLLFSDSGEVRLTGVDGRLIGGEIRVAVSEEWTGNSRLAGSVVGRFRAIRDTLREHALYSRARCDRPGAEWPRVEDE